MRSGRTQSPPAARGARGIISLALIFAVIGSCAPPAVERATPVPTPTASPTATTEGIGSPIVATPIVGARQRIERVALATRIASDDAPLDETTVVSEWPELIYLCVLMSEITDGTRLRAYWFQGSDIIGQSDASPPPTAGEPAWVALRYRPIAKLNPAEEYAVELRLGDQLIDRYLFRVGIGNPSDAIAELAFASGFDEHGKPTNVRTRFMPDDRPLTLRMRISNQVDPAGMAFTSVWFRGDAQIATIDGVLSDSRTGAEADPRRIEFRYSPANPHSVGDYTVLVLLNGVEIGRVSFEVKTEPPRVAAAEPTVIPVPPATSTPEPSPTPTATPIMAPLPTASPTALPTASATPVATAPDVRDVTFATLIDNVTLAPLDGPIFTMDRPAGTVADLWVAIFVTNLTLNDQVEIVVFRDGEGYGRVSLPVTARASGWIAADVHLDVPVAGAAFVYSVEVMLNGQRSLASVCQIRAA